jgi:hypothetical protein
MEIFLRDVRNKVLKSGSYWAFVGKPEVKRPVGRPKPNGRIILRRILAVSVV